eukprot:476894_1
MAHTLSTPNGDSDVDMDSDDNTVHLRICINKRYVLTENIDPSQDVWKSGELNENALNMKDLRNEIPLAFRTKKLFKRLFADTNQWQWTVYEYAATKAYISIQKSHDLQAYIASLSSICDEGNEKFLTLRIVFHRTIESKSVSLRPNHPPQQPVIHNVSNTILCDTCGQNIPFNEYKDHQFAHNVDSTYVAPEHTTQVLDGQKTNKNQSNQTHTSNDIPCEHCGKH